MTVCGSCRYFGKSEWTEYCSLNKLNSDKTGYLCRAHICGPDFTACLEYEKRVVVTQLEMFDEV